YGGIGSGGGGEEDDSLMGGGGGGGGAAASIGVDGGNGGHGGSGGNGGAGGGGGGGGNGGRGGQGGNGGGAIILSARGLLNVTDYMGVNISATTREENTSGALNGTGGSSGAAFGGSPTAPGPFANGEPGDSGLFWPITAYGGDGGRGGVGVIGGFGGGGGGGGAGGTGGVGGYGTPGMIKLHGSVILAERMSVTASNFASASTSANGKLTLISNMDDTVLNDKQPSLTTSTSTLVRGRTNYSNIVSSTPFDNSGAHPLIPNLEGGPSTYGFLHINTGDPMPTFYNKATVDGQAPSETLPPSDPESLKLKVFEAGIPGQLTPFTYTQLFVVNDTTKTFSNIFLRVYNSIGQPLKAPYRIGEWDQEAGDNDGQIEPGQYWTTTIPQGTHAHLLQLPIILEHPSNAGAFPAPGETITFTCRASSATTMVYQWQTDNTGPWGTIVGGGGTMVGDTTTYTPPAINEGIQGNYRVVITNEAGSVVSNSAYLNVYQKPLITLQPSPNKNIYPPQPTFFTVDVYHAFDPAPVPPPWTPFYPQWDFTLGETYTWYFRPRDDTGGYPSGQYYWEPVQGPSADPPNNFSSRRIDIVPTDELNQGDYYCHVENLAGYEDSEIGNLVVENGVHIIRHPEDVGVPPGYPASFTCEAEGPNPSYRWLFSTEGTPWVDDPPPGSTVNDHWQPIPLLGAGSNPTADDPTLVISSASAADEGWYLCWAHNFVPPGDYSNPAQLRLEDPGITEHPQPRTLNPGQLLQLSVTAQTARPPLSYRWQRAPIDTEDFTDIVPYDPLNPNYSASYAVFSCTEEDEAMYRVIVYNNEGASRTSNAAKVIVRNPPLITRQPEPNIYVDLGESAIIIIEAESDTQLTYQWFKEDVAVVDEDGHISGAQSDRLQFLTTTYEDEAVYTCHVTNVVDTVISDPCKLWVGPILVLDNERGGGRYYENTPTVRLGVDIHGGREPRTYQWFKNGAPVNPAPLTVPAGADQSVYLTLRDITTANQGEYLCRVCDSRECKESLTITVEVVCHLDRTPTILGDPERNLYVGEPLELELVIDCGGVLPDTFVWYKVDSQNPEVPITLDAGQDRNSFTIESVAISDSGEYYATVEDSGSDGPYESNHIMVDVSYNVPATGGLGLAALTAASALFGALALRRRKH
nr:immunoglobulin domain-containing protein [Candidatus Hydrogenedentota bacterium]